MSEISPLIEKKEYENNNLKLLSKIINLGKLSTLTNDSKCQNIYKDADPFPHICFKDLWEEEFLQSISNEFRKFENWETPNMSSGLKKEHVKVFSSCLIKPLN